MGWNDREPHASRIEAIMLDIEAGGIDYPESYDLALEYYTDSLRQIAADNYRDAYGNAVSETPTDSLTDWVIDLYREKG